MITAIIQIVGIFNNLKNLVNDIICCGFPVLVIFLGTKNHTSIPIRNTITEVERMTIWYDAARCPSIRGFAVAHCHFTEQTFVMQYLALQGDDGVPPAAVPGRVKDVARF